MSADLDELDQLMAGLGDAAVSGRTSLDRFREFRQVFLASDAGKRVLHDILSWGHIWKSSIVRDMEKPSADPYLTFVNEGERNLALKIIATLHKEPQLQPTTQRTTDGE